MLVKMEVRLCIITVIAKFKPYRKEIKIFRCDSKFFRSQLDLCIARAKLHFPSSSTLSRDHCISLILHIIMNNLVKCVPEIFRLG